MKLDFLSKQLLIFAAHSLLQTDAATAADAAVTTVDRPIITSALHLLLLLLILTLLMILLGMMIVANAANRAAGEKLLQLTAATTGFRLTCSAAACATDASAAILHFQLLAQLRVVVQIEVQVATDRGNGDGVRDGRGDCISQTSSYFGHRSRRRGRFGGRLLLLLLLFLQQRRSTVGTGAGVSRARWTVGEMIDQQRRGRRRVVVMVVVFAKIRRRLLQQQLGCDWCGSRAGRRSWRRQLLVVVQGGRRRKRTRRG